MEQEYLTTKEAAVYLGLSDKTVRNLCAEKRITHRRLSERIIQFKKEWLDEYLNSIVIQREIKEENENGKQ